MPIKISHSINYFGTKARHTIISTNKDYSSEDIIQDGLNVVIDMSHHDIRGGLLHRIKKHRKYLKNCHGDLLITYNWGAVEWALANSFGPIMRHIHVESGFGPEEATNTIPRRNIFRRIALRNIEFLSVPSMKLVEIARTKWKIPEKKIKYIPNGVDLEKFNNAGEHNSISGFQKNTDEVIIGTIAPLRAEKNISRMIHCFHTVISENPDIKTRLLIMGEGAERPKLDKLVKNLGIEDRVLFTGHISEPAGAIRALDIFAISSDTEQMPNSVNEAMAAGLPVVGMDVGDVKHMVSEENKDYIVTAGNDQSFSDAMKKLITDRKAQKTIGDANLDHVRKYYDRIDMYKKYAELWGIHEAD
ncbi:MAG: glycosyltransferase [Kordiimonadaceae bacterium]|nr:glycosyltransferase [Kordiimonadaceae bacterium]